MFNIFNKKYPQQTLDFSGLKVDMHAHLLPGIDDGAPDTDVSLQLINGLHETGFSRLITTPHILWGLYKNTPHTIGQAKAALAAASPGIATPHAAAEYFLDDHLMELIAQKQSLLTLYENYVLVEFSFVSAPLNWKEELFELQINGYQVVLAHPERYIYLADQKRVFDELKDMGIYLQMNLLSVTGYYNKTSRELARYLLKKNYIDFLGTDLHHHRHLHALREQAPVIMPVVNDLLASGHLKNPYWG